MYIQCFFQIAIYTIYTNYTIYIFTLSTLFTLITLFTLFTLFTLITLFTLFTLFQIYCCVGMLAILGRLHHVNADMLGWWLCERQLPSGGLNGNIIS